MAYESLVLSLCTHNTPVALWDNFIEYSSGPKLVGMFLHDGLVKLSIALFTIAILQGSSKGNQRMLTGSPYNSMPSGGARGVCLHIQ